MAEQLSLSSLTAYKVLEENHVLFQGELPGGSQRATEEFETGKTNFII